jgi:hypothetical protein
VLRACRQSEFTAATKRPWYCDDSEQTVSHSERPIATLCDRLEAEPEAEEPYDQHTANGVSSNFIKLVVLLYLGLDEI